MRKSLISFVSVALMALSSGSSAPACDDGGTEIQSFDVPLATVAYGGCYGGQALAPQMAPAVCTASQAAVVVPQAAPVVIQQAPAVVYRQAAPVVVSRGYGGSSGYVGRGVGFAPGVGGGGGIVAGRNVRIRKSNVSGLGSGVISAGRNVKIRKSTVGF